MVQDFATIHTIPPYYYDITDDTSGRHVAAAGAVGGVVCKTGGRRAEFTRLFEQRTGSLMSQISQLVFVHMSVYIKDN